MTSPAKEPVWLNEAALRGIHQRQLAEHGGMRGIRDEGLFLSAIARPMQLWSYGDPPPDLPALAASYAHCLAKNHPFLDGNKRIAAIACELFLIRNGLGFTVGEEQKYPEYLALAEGDHSEESFAAWLRTVTTAS
jgi:death-on-curing protein